MSFPRHGRSSPRPEGPPRASPSNSRGLGRENEMKWKKNTASAPSLLLLPSLLAVERNESEGTERTGRRPRYPHPAESRTPKTPPKHPTRFARVPSTRDRGECPWQLLSCPACLPSPAPSLQTAALIFHAHRSNRLPVRALPRPPRAIRSPGDAPGAARSKVPKVLLG